MKLIILLAASVLAAPTFADTSVRGYVRSDGTYVQPHVRSDSNSVKYDNYSSKGNSNPYTGERGSSRSELSSPSTYDSSSSVRSLDSYSTSNSRSRSR